MVIAEVSLGVAALVTLYAQWRCRDLVPGEARVRAAYTLHEYDNAEGDLSRSITQAVSQENRVKRTTIIAASLAIECRCKFDITEETPAVRAVAHKWMWDQLYREVYPDLRKTDRPGIIRVAMVLVFLPTVEELHINQFAATRRIVRRSADRRRRWWDWGTSIPALTSELQ